MISKLPAIGIFSLLCIMDDGASTESAVIGNEGVVGIALFAGGESTPSRAVVPSAGHDCRLEIAVLRKELERRRPQQHLLLR